MPAFSGWHTHVMGLLDRRTDAEFLQFIHDRLIFKYGENENYDYMHRLREIIAKGKVMDEQPIDFSDADLAHAGRAHIFKSELTGEWYLRLLAANGEIIASTEGHKNFTDMVDLHRKYFPDFIMSDEHGEPL